MRTQLANAEFPAISTKNLLPEVWDKILIRIRHAP